VRGAIVGPEEVWGVAVLPETVVGLTFPGVAGKGCCLLITKVVAGLLVARLTPLKEAICTVASDCGFGVTATRGRLFAAARGC
jgi:hypothetical protein